MKIINEETLYTAPVTHAVLTKKNVGTFPNSTTPSVLNVEHWKAGAFVVTVTNFLYGADGQRLYILGDGSLTVSNNASIKTNTGANKLLAANKVYCFTLFNNIWVEDAA